MLALCVGAAATRRRPGQLPALESHTARKPIGRIGRIGRADTVHAECEGITNAVNEHVRGYVFDGSTAAGRARPRR